jgi:hypothetical protein
MPKASLWDAEGIPSGLSSPVEFILSLAKGHSLQRSVILLGIFEVQVYNREVLKSEKIEK